MQGNIDKPLVQGARRLRRQGVDLSESPVSDWIFDSRGNLAPPKKRGTKLKAGLLLSLLQALMPGVSTELLMPGVPKEKNPSLVSSTTKKSGLGRRRGASPLGESSRGRPRLCEIEGGNCRTTRPTRAIRRVIPTWAPRVKPPQVSPRITLNCIPGRPHQVTDRRNCQLQSN